MFMTKPIDRHILSLLLAVFPALLAPARAGNDATFGMGADAVYAGRPGRESGLTLTAVTVKSFSLLRI